MICFCKNQKPYTFMFQFLTHFFFKFFFSDFLNNFAFTDAGKHTVGFLSNKNYFGKFSPTPCKTYLYHYVFGNLFYYFWNDFAVSAALNAQIIVTWARRQDSRHIIISKKRHNTTHKHTVGRIRLKVMPLLYK